MIATTDSAPLSFAQQRLWFLDQFTPGSALYNIPLVLDLRGPLDVAALERTLTEILRRHETLRTSFPADGGQPFQQVHPASRVTLAVEDLSALPDRDREARTEQRITEEGRRPFDLSTGPLFRAGLLRLGPVEHVLFGAIHHIVFDAWSSGVFMRELVALYSAFAAGEPSPLPELPLRYVEFAADQRERLKGETYANHLGYWRERLKLPLPLLALPTDRPRPAVQTFRGHRHQLALSEQLMKALETIGRREGATPFITLLAAFAAYLHRSTGQTDLLIGSPIANRTRQELEPLIGFFVNTLPLRLDLSGDPSFRELLQRTKRVAFGAYAHQDLPFERLVEELNPKRSLSHAPLLQTLITFDNTPHAVGGDMTAGDLKIGRRSVSTGTAKFDLTLIIRRAETSRLLVLETSADLFDPSSGERIIHQFVRLLEGIADDASVAVSRLPIMLETEHRQVTADWTFTARPFPSDRTLLDLIEEQAARSPDREALLCGHERATFAELNTRANRLARRLRELGVGTDDRVGVCLDRSPELLVSLLGILKAGGAYVPFDPAYPTRRLAFIAEDARIRVLVTDSSHSARVSNGHWQLLPIDRERARIEALPGEDLPPVVRPEDLAYVIYTSGSTGHPKGVAIPHRNVVNLMHWAAETFSRDELTGVLASTSISFDPSVFEMFVPLSVGTTVVLVDNLLSLPAAPGASRVTLINTVPSVMAEFLRLGDPPPSAGVITLCGEPVRRSLVDRLYERASIKKVYDLYGPTEATVFATCALRAPRGPETIGRPIANTKALVFDAQKQPVPVGVPGELFLGGAGVARGYLDRPDLTSERFVADPFSEDAGARLYRTGDEVRWLPDGNLEFLGRLDDQVKLRGFRIELGEIESVLAQHPSVVEVAAVKRDDPQGFHIAAYIVERQACGDDELFQYVADRLPHYMIPSSIVRIEAIPRLPNGKTDRGALSASSREVDDSHPQVPPATPTEEILARLWCEVLNLKSVGVEQDFFELGGHSLMTVRLLAGIESRFGVKLPLSSLFRGATIRQQAALLSRGQEKKKERWSPIVPLQPLGSRPPFFLVHGTSGEVTSLAPIARYLSPDQPVYGLRADTRSEARFSSLEDTATRYLAAIRRIVPHGPYRIGGYSDGGVIAYEMAQQIRRTGEKVALLTVIDSTAPGVGRRRWWSPKAIWELVTSRRDPASSREFLEPQMRAFAAYVPRPYDGDLTVLRARTPGFFSRSAPDLGWGELAEGRINVRTIPSSHDNILTEPRVRLLAAALESALHDSLP